MSDVENKTSCIEEEYIVHNNNNGGMVKKREIISAHCDGDVLVLGEVAVFGD